MKKGLQRRPSVVRAGSLATAHTQQPAILSVSLPEIPGAPQTFSPVAGVFLPFKEGATKLHRRAYDCAVVDCR